MDFNFKRVFFSLSSHLQVTSSLSSYFSSYSLLITNTSKWFTKKNNTNKQFITFEKKTNFAMNKSNYRRIDTEKKAEIRS